MSAAHGKAPITALAPGGMAVAEVEASDAGRRLLAGVEKAAADPRLRHLGLFLQPAPPGPGAASEDARAELVGHAREGCEHLSGARGRTAVWQAH